MPLLEGGNEMSRKFLIKKFFYALGSGLCILCSFEFYGLDLSAESEFLIGTGYGFLILGGWSMFRGFACGWDLS